MTLNEYALVRLYAREMDEKLPPFCRKKVRSTARKHAAQYAVDAAQYVLLSGM